MSQSYAKATFPKLYAKVEKNRETAKSQPLQMKEINTLLSMRLNKEPVYESIDVFYTEEYKKAMSEGKSSSEMDGIPKFRPATEKEANLLYCDIHARDEKEQYSGGGAQTE